MNRILVVLPNWFGETLFATPLLRALRQERPHAFIATLGLPRCREVLLHNAHVNELWELNERGRHRGPWGKLRLILALRRGQFDTAFILRRSLSRTLVLTLAGIPTRVGFANLKSGWLLTHRVAAHERPGHKAASYLPLLEGVGLRPTFSAYEYTVDEGERATVTEWRRASQLGTSRPLVILHPGANWPHKRWLPERFGALGDRLVRAHRAQIVVTGGRQDLELAASVKQHMQEPAIIIAGQTALRQLGAILEQAALVVSNDTGVLHVAAALGRPLVGLYGPTSPALTGPLGDPQRMAVVHHPDCCPQVPCYRPDGPPHAGMRAILVEEVVRAASELLARTA